MVEVMNLPSDSLDKSPSTQPGPTDCPPAIENDLPPPPLSPPHSSSRRRERDFRDRRDGRNFDRHPSRRGGDYYDRNMSPRPPIPRDRDREYKRRRSPSSPHRDRRYSPPRRSPPPFKRSRRGSPRDGSGYDHVGGYERGMGGRLGYMEEKGYGRFMQRFGGGYQDVLSDMDTNRGYADAANVGGAKREGLMSYKQFIQELEDDVLPSEAECRYQEYKSEYISTHKKAYFNSHKQDEWLKDKFHPTNLVPVIERRNENARRLAKDFLLDLQSGMLDLNPGVNASSSLKSGQASEPVSDDEADMNGKRRRHGRLHTKEHDFSSAPKAPPISGDPKRIQVDIEQAQVLVRKLDAEKGIEDNLLCGSDDKNEKDRNHSGTMGPIIIIRGLTSVKGLEGVELLDTLLTYLWRIHGVDYYGMNETHEAKGFRHVRPDGKTSEETIKSGSEWQKKLDSFWQERLNGQDPLEVMAAKDKIDAEAMKVLDPYVRKIRDEKYGWKYGCGAKGCTKLFHAAEFVHKHLKLKHPDLLIELTSKVREDLYYQNYMIDKDAPGGTPVMQQTQQEKPPRRRLLEGRLRDDCGNRRDYDHRINDVDQFDTTTNNSPSHERQSKVGGLHVGNHDESMFDAFTGQGVSVVPPFASDMPPPPPVLMPVPGAGPLGPFVPAPPEVAMQMLRDQGGPSTFDGAGIKIHSNSHIHGAAPIIAVPPALRPDPRRIRSYQDLDAPEDEVTVIDYRSL